MSDTATLGVDEAGQLVRRYLDALYDADAKLLGRVFHPAALYITADGEEVVTHSMDEYLPIVRVAHFTAIGGPAAGRSGRVGLTGSAEHPVAVVECRLGNVDYTDVLTTLVVGGQ